MISTCLDAHSLAGSVDEYEIKRRRAKECGVLDQWDKTSCENSGTFPNGCLAPSTASTTMFTCPAGSGLVFDAPPGPLPLNSLTCDTAKGEWILENIQGDKKTITELMGLIPGPYKFYCAK